VFDKNEKIGMLSGQLKPPVALLPREKRTNSFDEVDRGLTAEAAIKDAQRCLRCYRIAVLAFNE
jgi:formate dehydrogenase beta subunit